MPLRQGKGKSEIVSLKNIVKKMDKNQKLMYIWFYE